MPCISAEQDLWAQETLFTPEHHSDTLHTLWRTHSTISFWAHTGKIKREQFLWNIIVAVLGEMLLGCCSKYIPISNQQSRRHLSIRKLLFVLSVTSLSSKAKHSTCPSTDLSASESWVWTRLASHEPEMSYTSHFHLVFRFSSTFLRIHTGPLTSQNIRSQASERNSTLA